MAYTEKQTTSYGTRVGRSFKGILAGIILFIGGTVLLWWNEGRAVRTADMLEEAQKACVVMENPSKKDKSLEGELVCGTAMATTEDSLVDKDFGIGANAISLIREVEYFQWVESRHEETEDKLGGKEEKTITYTYDKKWVDSPISSAEFKESGHTNYALTTVEPEQQWAQNVTFGAYTLNESLIHSMSSTEPLELNLSDELMGQLEKNTLEAYERFNGQRAVLPTDSGYHYIHVSDNQLYVGLNAAAPQVGDVRVTFKKVMPAKVTVVSVVDDDTFKPFKASNGELFQKLVTGKKSIEEIFDGEKSVNTILTWLFRLLGTLLVIWGLKAMFAFIETILKVVPFLANIVGWGVGLVCTIVGVVWSLIVIAIAWLFYRPVLGITLLVIAGLLVWIFAFGGKNKIKQLANKKKDEPAQA